MSRQKLEAWNPKLKTTSSERNPKVPNCRACRPTLLLLKAGDRQASMDLANELMHQFQLLGIPGRRPGNTLLNPLAK